MDTEKYRFQAFLSDISGLDIEAHQNDPNEAIKIARDWLRTSSKREDLPGGSAIRHEYSQFNSEMPEICKIKKLEPKELTFVDYNYIIHYWLADRKMRFI